MSGVLEGENFVVRRGREDVPILILCEHASKALPAGVDLGIPDSLLDTHWGWDRWALDTMMRFAPRIGATTVHAKLSRLLIDVNRGVADTTLIRRDAGEILIPGNQGLSKEEREERVRRFHVPYHQAADAELSRIVGLHGAERVVFLTFHSFTGHYEQEDRNFEVGVLFDVHEDLAAGIKRALATRGIKVRLNEPYSGFRGEIYSAAVHGESQEGLRYFEIELNQEVIEDEARRQAIADVFAEVLPAIQPHLPNRGGQV